MQALALIAGWPGCDPPHINLEIPSMLLKDKVIIIHGAGGAVGSSVALAMARQGAQLFLAGRRLASVAATAQRIRDAGGLAQTAEVDALDETAVEAHAEKVFASAGALDVCFNATGIAQPGIQGTPLLELDADRFMQPVAAYLRSHFLTARAAARHMLARKKGVILMHTPEPARLGAPLVGGMGPAWAALEGLSRALSAELAPSGIRSVVMRSTGLPETATIDTVFELHARALGVPRAHFQAMLEAMTHRRRSTSLAELGDAAVFLASDMAAAMTGTVANLTGGIIVD
jgi:NAD(P)-dependent dehydrogenase (short-subunit alcohol dehydrogenase family)